jgi:hypothetical protein
MNQIVTFKLLSLNLHSILKKHANAPESQITMAQQLTEYACRTNAASIFGKTLQINVLSFRGGEKFQEGSKRQGALSVRGL